MAWVVTAWKPEVFAAAEREGVELPQPAPPREQGPAPGERFARRDRATLRESPLTELFRPTS